MNKVPPVVCWIIGALIVALGVCLLGDWRNFLGAGFLWFGCQWFAVDGGKEENRDKNWVE